MKSSRNLFWLLFWGVLNSSINGSDLEEQTVLEIPLSGEFVKNNPELSGLVWYKDNLILLTQYPDRFPEGDHGHLFFIPKEIILEGLRSENRKPINPIKVPFYDQGLSLQIDGFDGYEAIVFQGTQVFLMIEAKKRRGRTSYIISGEIQPDLSAIRLKSSSLLEVEPQIEKGEMSYETAVIYKRRIAIIFESNGRKVNPNPGVRFFDLMLNSKKFIPFPNVEYRITDATAVDPKGRFWVINFFYPGEKYLKSNHDSIAEKYGKGKTHLSREAVERLVEFQISESRVSMVNKPPIQLSLRNDGKARNWEGIVRLDDLGFILVTDRYPETILAFVSLY